ncbi:MAG: cell division topological specificity factor MinE [Rhodospirillales bacterium]|jgi:cell division topological specificity factor|nr:cell division topological specificity factor MinE [Rhodospirillales bacterium]
MRLFNLFRKEPPSANAARERLKIVLAHERAGLKGPDYLPKLHKDLIRVVRKYITVGDDKVSVRVQDSGTINRLEVNIELPTTSLMHH